MKTFRIVCTMAIVAAFAVSCCHCRAIQERTRRPLEGTEWQLIQLGGKGIQPESGSFTLKLHAEKRAVSGVGACNRLMGSYTLSDNRALTIGPLASTRMVCPELDQEEQRYFRMLESVTHYDMDGPMLLLFADGELCGVFQALPK